MQIRSIGPPVWSLFKFSLDKEMNGFFSCWYVFDAERNQNNRRNLFENLKKKTLLSNGAQIHTILANTMCYYPFSHISFKKCNFHRVLETEVCSVGQEVFFASFFFWKFSCFGPFFDENRSKLGQFFLKKMASPVKGNCIPYSPFSCYFTLSSRFSSKFDISRFKITRFSNQKWILECFKIVVFSS